MKPKLIQCKGDDLSDLDTEDLIPRSLGLAFDLSERQRMTGLLYTRPDSPSRGNRRQSALDAGFPEPGINRTCERLHNSRRQQAWEAALSKLFAAQWGFDRASIVLDLNELQSRARVKNDLQMLSKSIEMKMRFAGVYSEGRIPEEDPVETRRMTDRERQELLEIAKLRLRQGA